MNAIENDATLAEYKQGDTVVLEKDGYIGIPVEISVYYDKENTGAARPGAEVNSTPVVLYVVNADFERIGTESDVNIIKSMLDRGYAVAVCDYLNDAKAVSPALDWSAQTVRNQLKTGAYFADAEVFPEGTYYNSFVVPAGYDLSLNHVFWEIDKHATDGTLDKIVEIWNNDFRGVKGEVVIKWTDDEGNRKATQEGFDGSVAEWLDADGNPSDDGEYLRIKHTLAQSVIDCVKADGSPIDLNLYMHLIYPTGDVTVPVLALAGSAEHLANGAATADRPQLVGAVFNGYAGVMYDHGYTPMARDDHYGYFDGNAAAGHVTGDNLTYSIQFYNAVEINTAAMRYVRYLSLSDDRFNFDADAIGVYGNSKGGWMQFLGEEDPYCTPNRRIYPGHHGETRYENGDTLTVGVIDGGEEQPWLTWEGEEIDGGADLVYCSCGGTIDSITSTHAPTFITCNLNDGSYYWTSNDFVNVCRSMNVPSMWFEVNLGHTFGYGADMNWGVDVYEAFFDFAGYWLKGEALSVSYVTSDISYGGMPTYSPITVKFTGSVDAEALSAVTLVAKDGSVADGYWTGAFGNTEWTFHPEALKSNTEYTLTVPAGICGSNGLPTQDSVTYTYTTGYESAAEGVSIVSGTRGDYVYFNMPDASEISDFKVNEYLLRLNVTNDAANTVGIYSLSGFEATNPDAATVGNCVGSIAVNGRGYYEIDLTEALAEVPAGESCALLLKTEKTAAETQIYSATFEGKIDSGMSISGTVLDKKASELDGNGVLELGEQALNTSYVNNTFYGGHSLGATLACFGVIGGGELDYDDVGRRFEISFSIYDTIDRYVGAYLNECTSSGNATVDYNGYNYNIKTKANEWVDFSFVYDVYEPSMFGDVGCTAKNLYLTVPTDGNEVKPIYFDNFTSTEITTPVSLSSDGGASLVLTTTEQRTDPLETPYGTIPETYADTSAYPFAIFKKNATGYDFVTAIPNAFADSSVTSYRTINSEVVIYLRDDYTITSRFTNLRQVLVGVTLDLGGNTLTANSSSQSFYIVGNPPRVSTVTELFVNFKNGTIVTDSAKTFLLIGSNAAGGTVNYSVEFDNIVFDRPDAATNAHPIVEFTSSTSTFTTDITYNDCTFDMRGSETTLRVFTAGNSADTAKANVVVNGGELLASTTSNLVLTYVQGEDSSVKFGSGSNGYLTMELPTGTSAPTYSVVNKGGESLSFTKQESTSTSDIYSLISLNTPYGAIPSQYASISDYPFAIFKKTDTGYDFVTAIPNAFADSSVTSYRTIDSEIVIYLRDDYTITSRFTNLRQVLVGVTFDLGGNTLTANSSSQSFYVLGNPPRVSTVTELFVNFKNGTIVTDSAKTFLLVGSTAAGGTVNYSVEFQNIVFERPDAATNAHPIVEFTSSSSTFTTDITYNDCTFDMTGVATVLRVFTAGNSADTAKANVVVNGGELILSTTNKLVMAYVQGTESSVKFGKGSDGEYLTMKIPAGTAKHNGAVTSVGDLSCTFEKEKTESGFDYYRLSPTVTQGFGLKGNVTLYSDFALNIYIPKDYPVSSISFGGVDYTDLSSLKCETVDGAEYYVVTARVSVTAAASPVALSVVLEETDGTQIAGNWNISVVDCIAPLLSDDSETVKILGKDVLSYVRAAYEYNDSSSSAIAEIDALIGADYDATSKPNTDIEAKLSTEGLSSATLELGDAPAFRFYIDGNYDVSLYKFSVNGKAVSTEVLTDEGRTYIRVSMYAYSMVDTVSYTVDGTDVKGEYNIKSYYDFATDLGDAGLISLVERLWKYSESALAYKNEVVG